MPYILRGTGGIPEYAAGENYAQGSVFEYDRTLWRVNTAISNAPATPPMTSVHAIARNFDQGDNNSGGNSRYQLKLGYQNSMDYPSWIATRHSGASTAGEIRFNVNQGGQNEAFDPTKANFRIVGNGRAYLTNAAGQYVAPTDATSVVTKAYVDSVSGMGAGFVTLSNFTITTDLQYRVSSFGQNSSYRFMIGSRYVSGVSGSQQLDISTIFRTQGSASATLPVTVNDTNGTKIWKYARVHFDSGAYQFSLTAAVDTTINFCVYALNLLDGTVVNSSGTGTVVNTGSNYGGVAL